MQDTDIRLILKSTEDRNTVLKNAVKIRKATSTLYNPKTIFLVPDMTPLEREADLALRKKLKETRDQNPNDKFGIKKGKIVKL